MRRMIPNPLIKTIVDLKTANELEAKVYKDLEVTKSANIGCATLQLKTDGVSCVSICGAVYITNTNEATITIKGLPNMPCELNVFPATDSLGGNGYITIDPVDIHEHQIFFIAGQPRTVHFNAVICNTKVIDL